MGKREVSNIMQEACTEKGKGSLLCNWKLLFVATEALKDGIPKMIDTKAMVEPCMHSSWIKVEGGS